jgi:hypothetical protein
MRYGAQQGKNGRDKKKAGWYGFTPGENQRTWLETTSDSTAKSFLKPFRGAISPARRSTVRF